ncbi:adenosylcobinamide-GDP ribazoletransferase [Haloarculaceae archaeon H-GB1-1]|nr:adenosylcobinamide-GDP ribazoletransferase [Haloarculaceae archaeon H-GB1-1]
MVLTAVRGALGFLSRVPLGRSETEWKAFAATPAAFPLSGYVLGALVSLVFVLPLPAPSGALAFLLALAAVMGINHFDGVADLGDAAVVHGDAERRRDVMKDTDLGVGGALAIAFVVVGLALAGVALFGLPTLVAMGIVLASEVGAKTSMAVQACRGVAAHEGLGSTFTSQAGPEDLSTVLLLAAPAALVTGFSPAALASLVAAVATGLGLQWWARLHLGGTSGDVFGATNQLASLVALHAGVVVWTLW